jgi:multiple sugar transport system permease protein
VNLAGAERGEFHRRAQLAHHRADDAPGLAATAFICGILAFDEFLLASSFSNDASTRTLPVAIALFQGERLVNFGQMAVASITQIAPVYLIALFARRWLVGGPTVGGVK